MGRKQFIAAASCGALSLAATPALAADGLDGASFGPVWVLPFVGMLLSIALAPLAPNAWEHHQGKIAGLWALAVIVPLALTRGVDLTAEALLHTALLEYLPFILLLLALFTTAGGIVVFGSLRGTPAVNTALLAIGALLASLIGTTGASMIMIRPVLRANDDRRRNAHVVVFFIFLVSNIGGALTPLGDPPLFLGFLNGVSFFWTTRHLAAETFFVGGLVLAVFYALDRRLYAREQDLERFPAKWEPVRRRKRDKTRESRAVSDPIGAETALAPLPDPTPETRIRVRGLINFVLIAIVIGAILMSATWRPGIAFAAHRVPVEMQNLARDAIMLAVALASLALTPRVYRAANGFAWAPISEVAKLFAGIFVTIIPVLAMLDAGPHGALAPLVAAVTGPDSAPIDAAYFWLSGGLSSFLDNAPTYLVFYQLAGGDPATLMGPLARTLAAISCGAVFMGANSYIGNAPNFMVYAIARHGGVRMPNFFAYLLWSGGVLIPVFVLATLVFFA